MSQADWTVLQNGLSGVDVKNGVTNGGDRPNGGLNFSYGFNSQVATAGAIALSPNGTNFYPMALGGSMSGALKRGASGGPLNFAPMLFMSLQTNSVNATGYLCGLSDDDPHRIMVRKGTILTGLPAVSIGTQGVLKIGTETWLNNTWLHLKFDVIVNTNGDTILQVFRNDLLVNPVTAPIWVAVPGCENFIDDSLGVNSGSSPYTSGYAGYAFQTKDVARRAYFDQMIPSRQIL